MILSLSLAWAVLVVWLLTRAVLQFRAYSELSVPETTNVASFPDLTVVIPARNEADYIAGCVAGLRSQTYDSSRFDVVLVDDGSTDGTAEIARRSFGPGQGFRVAEAGDLPDGWTGKSHACWKGASMAGGEWLCFMDADTVPEPELLRAAVRHAEANGIDMLSLEPYQVLGSFWERVVIPAGLFVMAFFASDLRSINDPKNPDAAANGQFLLFRRRAYEAVGGHFIVRDEISEDTALARRMKAAGFRTFLMGAKDYIRVRMYTGLGEIWEGFSKNAVNVTGSRTATAATALRTFLVAVLAVVLPFWVAFSSNAWTPAFITATVLASGGSAALFATHAAGARHFGINPAYGLLFPVGYLLVGAIAFNSLWAYRTGRVRWKGRTYAPEDKSAVDAGDAIPAEGKDGR